MENKQTAIDWLIGVLWAPCQGIPSDIIEQAKQMEKEQIEKAFQHSIVAMVVGKVLSPEEYYNETYNKKEDGNL